MASAVACILAVLATFPVASQAHTECSMLSLVQPPTVALDPNITLMVGPTLLFESGEWVTVSWAGIEVWMFPDAFVAAFSPGTPLDDPNTIMNVAPVKYQFLKAGKPYPGGDLVEVDNALGGARNSGAGADTVAVSSLRFRLLNLRDVEGYRFGLFLGGVEAPVLVAKTEEAVTFAQPFEVRSWYCCCCGSVYLLYSSTSRMVSTHAPRNYSYSYVIVYYCDVFDVIQVLHLRLLPIVGQDTCLAVVTVLYH